MHNTAHWHRRNCSLSLSLSLLHTMSFISRWILLNVLTAILPPLDPTEEDYYSRLGLDKRKKVTAEEIRRAYRTQSLRWHPDKIAQRSADISPAQAAAKFQGIQEAYQVLTDPEKRRQYHYWNCSNARYQFVHSNNNSANPAALYHNLASARYSDKARLVAAVGTLLIICILPFVLIASKLNQSLEDQGSLVEASWAVLLTPVWIAFCINFALVGLVMYVTKTVSLAQIVGLMERACWLSALVILVQRWDGNRQIDNWHATSIPFYFAVAFRIVGQVIWMGTIQQEMNKMISLEHLQMVEAEMLSGTTIEDLTEEELLALHSRYHVVNPDPIQVAEALEILKAQDIDLHGDGQEEELEAVRVQCSPEFQAASESMDESRMYAAHVFFFGIPLIPLTACKLNGTITASWWVVILPIWVYWATRLLQVCTLCFGYAGDGGVVVVDAGEDKEEDADAKDISVPQGDFSATKPTPEPSAPDDSLNGNVKNDKVGVESNVAPSMAPLTEEDEEEQDEEAQKADKNPFPTPYNLPQTTFVPPDDDVLSEAPSDEGAWRESLPRDPPGVSPDVQELQRLEMERRKKLFEATQKVKVAAAPSPASTDAPVDTGDVESRASQATSEAEQHRDEPEMDEDTFREWQRMQGEADASAMAAQSKASWICCTTLFQMLMVCLVVGKLEHDYPRPADGSVGYSAFWIIFPLLLLSGIILCCCSCMIFFTGDPEAIYGHGTGAASATNGETTEEGEKPTENGGAPDIYMAPPSTTPAPAPPKPNIETPEPSAKVPPPVQEEAEGMDELD